MAISTRLRLLLALSLSLVLAGCGTPTTASLTEAGKTASSIGHVRPSTRDTCETQRQLAAQSSRIDTIVQGRETVYQPAACEEKRPVKEPKTS